MPVSKKVTLAVFLGGAFLLFTLGLFLIGDRRMMFERSIELRTQYRQLSGLKVGSKVLVSGMDAGEVLGIDVPGGPEGRFEVRFRVLEKFRPMLRSDSVATIQMDGLVGNKVLQIGAGTPQGRELQPGDLIASREPVEISELIKEAVETVQYARGSVADVREAIDGAVDLFEELTRNASEIVKEVGNDAKEISEAGRQVSGDVRDLVAGVKAGRGSLGKLVTDETLYERIRGTVGEAERAAGNLREISDDAKAVTSELRSAGLAAKFDRVVTNAAEAAEKGKRLVEGLLPERKGESGLSTDLRQTIANANKAMADFAENMEALKRNWFFRGFFNQRGFFDLDAVSVADYQAGRFAPDRVPQRRWLHRSELFVAGADGAEELSPDGRRKLDEVAVELLRQARNNPLMIEGYASAGAAHEQLLTSLARAAIVRDYLLRKYPFQRNYVGVMPMGAVASSDPSGAPWDGVSVVLYLPREAGRGR
jgi:phospholipid/cholesterol/gamma-HCH transport system substrate-binding protein